MLKTWHLYLVREMYQSCMVWYGMAWHGMVCIYIYIYMYTYIIYGANIGKSLMNGDLMILMGQVMENMMIYFRVGGAIFSEKAK